MYVYIHTIYINIYIPYTYIYLFIFISIFLTLSMANHVQDLILKAIDPWFCPGRRPFPGGRVTMHLRGGSTMIFVAISGL